MKTKTPKGYDPKEWTVLRIKKTTLNRFNYARAKAVTPENPKYQSQDEFLCTIIDRKA